MDDDEELARMLSTTANTSERVRALLSLGLTASALSTATVSSPSTIRNWSSGSTQPRGDALIALDDLRSCAKILIDAGLGPARTAGWLMSREMDRLGGLRPIEMIPRDPLAVIAAAQGVALQAPHTAGEVSGSRDRSGRGSTSRPGAA